MVSFIDANRAELGVAPVCKVLQIAPSTYYTAKARPESARAARDVVLTALILMLFKANYSVYGARKMWKAVRRKGEDVGRDRSPDSCARWVCGVSAVVGRCSRHARTRER